MHQITSGIYLPIAAFLLLASCSTSRINDKNKLNTAPRLTSTDIGKLNGTFANKPIGNEAAGVNTLWERLFTHFTSSDRWPHAQVKIEVTSPKTVTFTLLDAYKPIDTRIVRFKLRKGQMKLKKQLRGEMTVGPLVWGLQVSKSWLWLTADNQLKLFDIKGGTLMVLFMPVFGSGGENEIAYSRVE